LKKTSLKVYLYNIEKNMSLALKYRPDDLNLIKGNLEIVDTLKGMLSDLTTCPHSFLLHGQTGCGKTTIARIIASKLGCEGDDRREIDSADFRGIDTIRDLRRKSQYMATNSNNRIWIIDECHKLTNDAQNALLKILEEPPPHVYFVLCTTEPNKLLETIKGRCIQLQVKPLNDFEMKGLLRKVLKGEEVSIESEIIDQIIQDSMGLPRNALNILEQVMNAPEDQRLEVAQQTAAKQGEVFNLCRALLDNSGWKKVKGILESVKDQEPETIRRIVLGYCQSVLLRGENDKAAAIMEAFWEPTYNIGFPGIVYACYSVTKN